MSLHDSSIPVSAGDAPLPPHEWEPTGWVPDKSKIMDYGYVTKGQAIGCIPEELIETLVRRKPEIDFVWTPQTAGPVRPEQVPFLIEAFRRIEARQARTLIWWGAGALLVSLLVAGGARDNDTLSRNTYLIIGAIMLSTGNWKYWRSRSYTQEDAISDASVARFETWIKKRRLNSYTIATIASIVGVGAFQVLVGDSIAAAGLVKPAVWRGEVWRLFTATLMHVGFYHLLLNAAGFIYISSVVEQTIQRAFVPLLFLVSAVVGSLFSVLLSPETTSIGASGGIMGLLGFIVIAAYLDRTKYPPEYFKRMMAVTLFFGSLPAVGFNFMDNATHLGGLVTGLTLGWLCTRLKQVPIKGKLLRLASATGVVAVVSTAVFAIYRIING